MCHSGWGVGYLTILYEFLLLFSVDLKVELWWQGSVNINGLPSKRLVSRYYPGILSKEHKETTLIVGAQYGVWTWHIPNKSHKCLPHESTHLVRSSVTQDNNRTAGKSYRHQLTSDSKYARQDRKRTSICIVEYFWRYRSPVFSNFLIPQGQIMMFSY